MGQSQKKKLSLLTQCPHCIYCGELATEVDHCPPRSFFTKRAWPEGFAFSCCKPCNEVSAPIEQQLALFVRLNEKPNFHDDFQAEYKASWRGLRNNHLPVANELFATKMTPFGYPNWSGRGPFNAYDPYPRIGRAFVGPLLQESIALFAGKIGKAIHFHETQRTLSPTKPLLFSFVTNTQHSNELFTEIRSFVRRKLDPQRGNTRLHDQFSYTATILDEAGFAVYFVKFNEALVLIICLANDARHYVNFRQMISNERGIPAFPLAETYFPPRSAHAN